MPAEQTNIKVVVRVRPYNKREQEQNQRCIIKVMDSSALLFDPDEEDDEFFFQGSKQQYRDISKRMNKKLSMDFDRVFDTENSNQDIFTECTAPLVDSALNGYNCSVFVYGATGAGKTFTMLGSDSCPGLTFLTMRDLFEKIEAQQDVRKFEVGVSYLEVYNEHVMNLLTKTGPLKLREDSNGVVVSGLVLTPIHSAEELLRLLELGNANRTQHPTDANAESSRSHAIFQVHIRMTDRKTGTKRTVKLSMIDLAGSERAASTKGIGMRFKEGASINKSLLALGNCINKLADGLKHIPYRDSNLTRILKDSLGGNCRTLMVANVSMSSLTYEDTYNTLKYASRAKKIRTTLRQNVLKTNMPKEFYVKKVTEVMTENERLVERNKQMEAKLLKFERDTASHNNIVSYDAQALKPWYSKIDAVYASVIKTQEYAIGIRSRIKNLSYRQTMKKDLEEYRKLLSLDQRLFQEDYVRFQSYIAKLTTQYEQHIEELPRWRTKLQDAYKDVEKLKREVRGSKHREILSIYLRSKDLEVQLSKQNINSNHLSAINMELNENSNQLRKSYRTACEVLHQTYDSLQETQKLTPEIQMLYERLLRKVRFTENEPSSTSTQDGDVLLASKEEDEERVAAGANLSGIAKKRTRLRCSTSGDHLDLELDTESYEDTDSDGGGGCTVEEEQPFKKPRNLNETRVINTATPSTAPKSTTITKSRNISHRLVADILSEQNVSGVKDKEKIKQALLKSNNFSANSLQRTVAAAALQKENLKHNSNYVRKSPRALIAKTLSGTSALTRKVTPSRLAGTIGSGAMKEAPLVRINRAASFRVKK
ncbi:kinesin-like protein KIF18A [Scaptodrosophila lebanonensis]|uniref:Kinesin-like protein KIF18A n=1 Tax=Drosophila lebanonensis TaxID=7225 RepID=A0A6J2TCP6_DROLE|nr:kinesin-like protein KIF18A [Scaptodrosophila lebanonensis]